MYYPFDKLIKQPKKKKNWKLNQKVKHAKSYQLHLQDKNKGHRLKSIDKHDNSLQP